MILPRTFIVAFAYYELYLFPKTEFEFLFDVLMLCMGLTLIAP